MYKDYLLLGIVSLMSVAANLPEELLGMSGIDRKLLLVGLLLVVTIALVRYSKLALILAVAILAFGANLPINQLSQLVNTRASGQLSQMSCDWLYRFLDDAFVTTTRYRPTKPA